MLTILFIPFNRAVAEPQREVGVRRLSKTALRKLRPRQLCAFAPGYGVHLVIKGLASCQSFGLNLTHDHYEWIVRRLDRGRASFPKLLTCGHIFQLRALDQRLGNFRRSFAVQNFLHRGIVAAQLLLHQRERIAQLKDLKRLVNWRR